MLKQTLVVEVLSADITSQLNILWHYGDAFWMDSTQVGIFQEAAQIVFSCFLQCHDCTHLEVYAVFCTHLEVYAVFFSLFVHLTKFLASWYNS